MTKLIYLVLGGVSLCLALLGIFLPLLPTTPFLLLAGYCFARSSKNIEAKLRASRLYQLYVADFAETKSISKKKKKIIFWQIFLLMGISISLAPLLPVKIGLFCLTCFITYYLFYRIPDKDDN